MFTRACYTKELTVVVNAIGRHTFFILEAMDAYLGIAVLRVDLFGVGLNKKTDFYFGVDEAFKWKT